MYLIYTEYRLTQRNKIKSIGKDGNQYSSLSFLHCFRGETSKKHFVPVKWAYLASGECNYYCQGDVMVGNLTPTHVLGCWQRTFTGPSLHTVCTSMEVTFPGTSWVCTKFFNTLLSTHAIYYFHHILRSLSFRTWIPGPEQWEAEPDFKPAVSPHHTCLMAPHISSCCRPIKNTGIRLCV